jgi:calcium channel MID1
VPSSPEFKNKPAELGAKYDTYASDLMTNFSNSLAQIPCNATDTAQYSLASTCTDCANSYKTWLCAVLMPRCEPFSTNSTLRPELVERAVNSSFPASDPNNKTYAYPADDPRRMRFATARSRNPFIDEEIQPGPYKELLPCEDLCFDLVRTCPATLGFACPNRQGMNASYAKRSGDERLLGCNFPGAVVNLNVKPSAGNRVGGVGSVGVMGVVAVSVVVGLGLGW